MEKEKTVTLCPECMSDMTYQLIDGDGFCRACGAMIPEVPHPGISHMAIQIMKGRFPRSLKILNEEDRKETAEEKARQDRLRREAASRSVDVTSILKEIEKGPPKERQKVHVKSPEITTETYKCGACNETFENEKALDKHLESVHGKKETVKKPRGNGWSKAKKWFGGILEAVAEYNEGKKIGSLDIKPKVKTIKVCTPKVGEEWSVGPCKMCGLGKAVTGTVLPKEGKKFVVLQPASGGNRYFGCVLCAKKA